MYSEEQEESLLKAMLPEGYLYKFVKYDLDKNLKWF